VSALGRHLSDVNLAVTAHLLKHADNQFSVTLSSYI